MPSDGRRYLGASASSWSWWARLLVSRASIRRSERTAADATRASTDAPTGRSADAREVSFCVPHLIGWHAEHVRTRPSTSTAVITSRALNIPRPSPPTPPPVSDAHHATDCWGGGQETRRSTERRRPSDHHEPQLAMQCRQRSLRQVKGIEFDRGLTRPMQEVHRGPVRVRRRGRWCRVIRERLRAVP